MKITYEDLLSGDPVFVEGIGRFRSPLLKELKPAAGIGINTYNLYLSILSWEKDDFLRHIPESQAALLGKNDKLSVFDMMTALKPEFREILHQALSFFMTDRVEWDGGNNRFLTYGGDAETGGIDRENFDDARDAILQLNYIVGGRAAEPKHSSEKARKYWELAQQKKKEAGRASGENKYLRIGNIISKLCAAPGGYTFHNIYELTVYQLYDAFAQCGFLRAMNFNENIVATHGTGKDNKFNLQEWMKPIIELQIDIRR